MAAKVGASKKLLPLIRVVNLTAQKYRTVFDKKEFQALFSLINKRSTGSINLKKSID